MDIVLSDVRYGARALRRMRGTAVVAVLTLALGIGATTTMLTAAHAALLREPPFADPDRLALLYLTRATAKDGLVRMRWSRPETDLLAASTSFEAVATFSTASVSIAGESAGANVPEQLDGEIVSPDYFRVLRVAPAAGRALLAGEDRAPGADAVVVLSDQLWRRRFASDAAIVGGRVRVNDVPLTVVGIAPRGFSGVSGRAQLWLPRTMAPTLTYADYLTSPQHFISVIARLRTGVALTRANAELEALARQYAGAAAPADGQWSAVAIPIVDARVDARVRRSVVALLGAALCVLLIACVNVAALLLARARLRRREIAIRLAIGSSRTRLVRQLLVEGVLLAAVAGAAGAALAAWGIALFSRTAPGVAPAFGNDFNAVGAFAAPDVGLRVLAFAAAVALGTTLLFALAPALGASKPDLVSSLKEDDRGGGGKTRALGSLVIAEVALAVLLLAASGLLIESFARLQSLRGGFDAERVLTFWIRPPASRYTPADGPALVERMLTMIQRVPGVESAAVNRATPFSGGARSVVFFPGGSTDPQTAPPVGRHYVSADYFRSLGIPLRAGRALTDEDRAGRPAVAVVNETAARRFWPGENPIGKRVWFGTTTGPFSDAAHAATVVGVVGDVTYDRLAEGAAPDFYTSYLQFAYPDTMVIVKARAPSPATLAPALRTAVAAVDPTVPIFDVMTLDDRVDAALARPRFNAAIVAAFAAAALLLAAIGVYGVLSYSLSSRMHEIGVRVALGADAARVMTLILGDGLRLAVVGAGVGVVAAAAVARVMRALIVGVADGDLRAVGVGAAVMVVVAGAAAWVPARRASRVDPLVVLRDS